jgi:formate-dependent nitrite reductase membrane component NrfD
MVFYLASLFIAILYYYKYWQLKTWANLNNYRYAQSVANCIMLISQILMFSVLWPLTLVKTEEEFVAQEVVMSEYDEEA